jgi:membrane protease YdiL (CAAX protease family)
MHAVQPRFAERHPITYFVLLYVAMMFIYILGGAIVTVGKLDTTVQILFSNSILAVVAVLVIARLGWWEEVGLAPVHGARPWLLPLIPVMFGLSFLLDGIHVTAPARVFTYLVCAFSVGFVEEIYFRGLFMRILKPYGQGKVLFWSTLVFGVTHALNLLSGQSGMMTAVQIAYATAFGFLFAVLRQQIGSLWTLVAAHTFVDFMSWITQGEVYSNTQSTFSLLVLPAAFAIALIAQGTWLLRSAKQR